MKTHCLWGSACRWARPCRASVAIVLLVACASAPPPPPPVPETVPFPHAEVWTRAEEATLTLDSGARVALPYLFRRLDVVGRDTIGLRVRCAFCAVEVEGYIDEEAVIHSALPPEVAAWGTLAEFALSIRAAASERDLEALEPVMAPDFFFSFVGTHSPATAFAVWEAEDFATLDSVPRLLDQGLGRTGTRIWSAPPAFLEDLTYRGVRIGFRQRLDGRWEWVYLVRGVVG